MQLPPAAAAPAVALPGARASEPITRQLEQALATAARRFTVLSWEREPEVARLEGNAWKVIGPGP